MSTACDCHFAPAALYFAAVKGDRMAFFPHSAWWAVADQVSVPGTTRARPTDDRGSDSDLRKAISHALRRGVTAKFFTPVGADADLRADLKAVCCEAKRQNMKIEHLIIAFKDAWRALPEANTYPQGTQGSEFLAHVITLCIAEFYSGSRVD
jgi:hypothetical protein